METNSLNQKRVRLEEGVLKTAKQFFGSRYKTIELFADQKSMEEYKANRERTAMKHGTTLQFFESADGIIFYVAKLQEGLNTIIDLKPHSVMSGGELWKFGYVTKDGDIMVLFNDSYVAQGRDQAKKMFAKVVEYCKDIEGSTPFATKS